MLHIGGGSGSSSLHIFPPGPHGCHLCNIRGGRYIYLDDLLALDRHRPGTRDAPLPAALGHSVTPLCSDGWALHLRHHPDQHFVAYLLQGIKTGFRLGFDRSHDCQPATRNLRSARDHPEVIDTYIGREKTLGRVIPRQDQQAAQTPELTVSPIGVIPKHNRPDKWRLIVDLSSPKDRSVNDGISDTLCSLTYASMGEAATLLQTLGKGALLAKLDLKEAYRAVPVHPQDRPLLGMRWRETTYLDAALPFGLRSAPKIFSALADGLIWIIHNRGFACSLHYLDDFLFLGPPDSPACGQALSMTLQLCTELGIQVAEEKTEGPGTTLTFLGIQIDTLAGQLRLPQEKLRNLVTQLEKWMPLKRPTHDINHRVPRRTGTKRDLLSLIGLLNHAATVVRPGRTFLRSLIDASATVVHLEQHVTLPAHTRADIAWWHTFAHSWNGTSIIPPREPTHSVYSDASGAWGCGAFSDRNWFQLPWSESWAPIHIAAKEMVPIVIAAALWGHQWTGSRVRCYCDNMAVVCSLNRGSARDPQLMRLLRTLFFFCAAYDCSVSAQHVAGIHNEAADALSRNNLSRFMSFHPPAHMCPSTLPPELLEIVLDRSLLWTSPSWTRLFAAILNAVWHPQPCPPTPQPSAAMQAFARRRQC